MILIGMSAIFDAYDLPVENLVPWPKEARNGIEWAKRYLETYMVQW